jgi:hypothetical protein
MVIVADPITLTFQDSSGKTILEGDLLDIMNAAHDACSLAPMRGDKQEQFYHEIVLAFRKLIEERCGVQLATSQAEIMYVNTVRVYQEFKKRLEAS